MACKYYDLDDILAEEERIPVRFALRGPGLGFLDPTLGPRDDIPQGKKLELPLWLAVRLTERRMVTASLPHYYSERFRSKLQADPSPTVIPSLGVDTPYYFDVGLKLAALVQDDRLAPSLAEAFAKRYKDILDVSRHGNDRDIPAFTSALTVTEKQLFDQCHAAAATTAQWRKREGSRIVPVRPSSYLNAGSLISPRVQRRRVGDRL